MKTSKRFLALVLSALMIFSVVIIPGADLSLFGFEADAAEGRTIDGITQKRVVGADGSYKQIYAAYEDKYFNGNESNRATDFVIPGLNSTDNYIPQGMTYWPEKEWILISSYHSKSEKDNAIFAIDVVTTEFVAVFYIKVPGGGAIHQHSGVAVSEHNLYYTINNDSAIGYCPLTELNVEKYTAKTITLVDSVSLKDDLYGAKTSYCCYDDGVLWTGNFYMSGDDSYGQMANAAYGNMLLGYKLFGDDSAEEWHYLKNYNNLIKINTTINGAASNDYGSKMVYNATNYNGSGATISGTITHGTPMATQEIVPGFATVDLVEGKTYKIEFTSSNNLTDMYMFAPNGGGHCNVDKRRAVALGDGRYHYELIFSPGIEPENCDSSWGETQLDAGKYTGTYSIRFDQDDITADRHFMITDIAIREVVNTTVETNPEYEGIGCAGNPTYCIAFDDASDQIQYAMVHKGKVYMSRSYSRYESKNHIRELAIADIDINSPGNVEITVSGKQRKAHNIKDGALTKFGGDTSNSDRDHMLWMGEALCIINDKLYMNAESAAWKYNGEDTGENGMCPEPIDVIWEIDQYEIMKKKGVTINRPTEDVRASHYVKVTDIEQLNNDDEYLIVFESPEKDPVSQKNVLYLLDAFGSYGENKLPRNKNTNDEQATGGSMGIRGFELRSYSTSDDGNILYVDEEVDSQRNLRWKIEKGTLNQSEGGYADGAIKIKVKNTDLYYATTQYLNMGNKVFSMNSTAQEFLVGRLTGVEDTADFVMSINGANFLWCNYKGTKNAAGEDCFSFYDHYYKNAKATENRSWDTIYDGLDEIEGTFHTAAINTHCANIMGSDIADLSYGYINFYKRVQDEYASTYDSRVYTDMNAELQADGTYKINIDTYAISNLQYQKVNKRPTDFIFVLDASGSMTNNSDAIGYQTDRNWNPLLMRQACNDAGDSFFARGANYNTAHSGNFWFKFPDGEFGQIHVAFNEKGSSSKYERDIWLWAEHPVTKRCYRLSKFGFMTKGNFAGGADWNQDSAARITDADFLANHMTLGWANEAAVMTDVNADRYRTDYHGTSYNSTAKRGNYEVMYYKYADAGVTASYYTYGNCYRLRAMQQAVEKLSYKIENEAQSSGLDHRVALVTFGSDSNESWLNTGMYTNGTFNQYNGSLSSNVYKNAFYSTSNFATFRSALNSINTQDNDPDTYSNYGFDMANNIIANETAGRYLADGDRSVCIVMITDGVPGLGNNNAPVATSTANAAIANAHSSKEKGAYVYSVLIGNDSCSGFNMNNYMNYVSSEYIDARSLTDSGDRNIAQVDYRINVPTGSSFNITNLVNEMFNSITSNSTNALEMLDNNAYLREHVTDAFDISNAKITPYYVPAWLDGIGRPYFDYANATSNNSVTAVKNGNVVTATGYNYSTEYVHSDGGNMLRLTLTNVLANPDAELVNTSINKTETTAIYQTQARMDRNQPFKRFPTAFFTIPEYTYVLDYGLKMYDNDINGTLLSVDSLPQKQTNYKNELSTNDMGIKFTNNNLDMIYSLKPSSLGNEATSRGYCLIQRDDGTYDWFRINVLPASNVYYEENNGTTITNNTSYSDWSPVKDENATASPYQELSTTRDVYGYDENYDNQNTYSYGTVYTSQVDANTMRSDTISFGYTGTAVDIVASCGNETGIYIVTIKNGTSVEKAYIVDTYFTDSSVLNGVTQLNQVPIVHHENANGYGTYTAEVTSVYLSSIVGGRSTYTLDRFGNEDVTFFSRDITEEAKEAILQFAEMEYLLDEDIEVVFCDENSVLNGGTGVEGASGGMATFGLRSVAPAAATTPLKNYFDGYRVYKTMGTNETDYIESEQGSAYFNVINSLASANSIINEKADNFVGYVVGNGDATTTFADYAKNGPANEVYLSNGNDGLTFTVPKNYYNKVMISLRAVSGAPVAKIGEYQFTVKSNTEMYYDITDYIAEDGTITIQNVGGDDGLLAVNNIKIVSQANMPAPVMMFSMPRIRMMMSAPAEDVEPNTPIETESNVVIPEPLPVPEEPSTEPEIPDVNGGTEEEKDFIEQITENFTKLLNMIQSMLERIVNLLKSLMA